MQIFSTGGKQFAVPTFHFLGGQGIQTKWSPKMGHHFDNFQGLFDAILHVDGAISPKL